MKHTHSIPAPRKAVNISLDPSLLAKARALKINLSATLEQALIEQVATREQTAWLAENRAAIDAYNQLVAEHGCFGDVHRSF